MKRGALNKHEKKFINDNLRTLDYMQIAHHLDRKPDTVLRYIESLGFEPSLEVTDTKEAVIQSFKDRPFYGRLRSQFTADELIHFEREFLAIEEQLGSDILPTERDQMLDLVKTSILMERTLKQNKDIIDRIEQNRSFITEELHKEAPNKALIEMCRADISRDQSLLKNIEDNYRAHQDRKSKLLDNLKASRHLRIKEVESRTVTFGALIKNLVADTDFNKEVGIEAEKMRLAMIDEEIRLAAYFKYEDGTVDQPLLTPDTVKDDNTP